MKKTPPPPKRPRPQYSAKIKAMGADSYIFLSGAPAASIKSIAWRLGDKMKRKYLTQKAEEKLDGVHVWRTA